MRDGVHLVCGGSTLFWSDGQLPSRKALLLTDGLEYVLLRLVGALLLRLLHHGLLGVLHACGRVGSECVCVFPLRSKNNHNQEMPRQAERYSHHETWSAVCPRCILGASNG